MKLVRFILLVILSVSTYSVNPIFAQEPANYWGVDGSDIAFQMDTRYLRFFEFPILVYMPDADASWSTALDEALYQLSDVVDIQRTYDPAEADIMVTIAWGDAYLAHCPRNTLGCSSIKPTRLPDRSVAVIGTVTLLFDNGQKAYTAMHELIHALGIAGHSPDAQDVMYHNNQYAPTVLSERDKNTLNLLYTSPGLQEDHPRG